MTSESAIAAAKGLVLDRLEKGPIEVENDRGLHREVKAPDYISIKCVKRAMSRLIRERRAVRPRRQMPERGDGPAKVVYRKPLTN